MVWLFGFHTSVQASLTLLPAGPPLGTHPGNLVTNGSFETAPPPGTIAFWATGTAQTPFGVPPGWQSSGDALTYAYWGRPNLSPPYDIAGSAPLPDGQSGVYFGNASAMVDLLPTFQPDRQVTFSGTPTFSPAFGQPARLWQIVPTNLTPAPSYILSFWASGEAAGYGGGGPGYDGIFGLRLTNVLPGDPIQYLVVPSGGVSVYGDSTRYEYAFTPLNPSLPVTVEFINWGHMDFSNFGGLGTTELVIDDVIVNPVPEPATAVLLGLAACLLRRRPGGRTR
ncbi:MAG: PEP-CTERM sorting domain-containing protein [Phycisphaeraceae bacterium]|nr:PEP-CTERM sorting domain-containing protein [Phycisphaeraceae bacterium]